MAQSAQLPCKGLYVDPNPLLAGSQGIGGLCRADEVIFEKAGQATSRPGFAAVFQDGGVADRPHSMYAWESAVGSLTNGLVISSYDSGTWYVRDALSAAFTGDQTPPEPELIPMQFVEARKNLYLTTNKGIRKILPATPTVIREPGAWMFPWQLFGFGQAGGTLGTGVANFRAAYRFVLVSKDSSGYERRSAPSPRIDLQQTGAPAVGYGLSGRFYIHNGVQVGDVIELYRTKIVEPATSAPNEEYYLAYSHTIDATDVANGYTPTFSEDTHDESLGVALYTNPSTGGIEASKELPPIARCVANFAECTWYGNTEHRERAVNWFKDGPTSAEVLNWTKVGCQLTAGSEFITNVPDITDLRVGMAVCSFTGAGLPGDGYWGEGNAYFSPDTLVVGITGAGPYTIEVDKPALSTAVRDCTFTDVLGVTRNGVTTYFYWSDTIPLPALTPAGFDLRVFGAYDADPDTEAKLIRNAFTLIFNQYAWNNQSTFKILANYVGAFSDFGTGSTDAMFALESTDFGGGEITITSNRGDVNFVIPLGTGQVSDPTRRPNRVYFSQPQEPEAVPILNYLDIGSQAHPIQAMVSTGAALYVFKTDGLYRVAGSAPSSWRVDLVSGDVRLVYGGCATAVDSGVAAWTTQGAIAVNDMQLQNLSEGKVSSLLRKYVGDSRILDAATADYTIRMWTHYWPRYNCVLFGWSSEDEGLEDAGNTLNGCVWVYNIGSAQWSKWTCNLHAVARATRSGELFASYRRSEYWDIRAAVPGFREGHDESLALGSFTSVDTSSMELGLADREFYIPKVGDWLVMTIGGTDYWRRVSSIKIVGAVHQVFWDDVLPSAAVVAVTVYETIETRLQWQAQGFLARSALFRELFPLVVVEQSGEKPTMRVAAGAASDITSTVVKAQNLEISWNPAVRSKPERFGVSRTVARSTHLYPYVEVGEPGARWAIQGLAIEFHPTSEKMKR